MRPVAWPRPGHAAHLLTRAIRLPGRTSSGHTFCMTECPGPPPQATEASREQGPNLEKIANSDLVAQSDALREIILASQLPSSVLDVAAKMEPPDWYLGAGVIAQTVWNLAHGYEATQNIKDCDLAYCDTRDLSYEAEDRIIRRGQLFFKGWPVEVEIRNQARVHLWYEQKFGKPIKPYSSTEEAINTWPTTATSVGVTVDDGNIRVYAPYGLHDLFAMIVRPNKTLVTRQVYEAKASRWAKAWPKLRIEQW